MNSPLFPPIYLGPHLTPLYWANESTGELKAAVMTFFHVDHDGEPLTPRQWELVRAYVVYVMQAPCWLEKHPMQPPTADYRALIEDLRRKAREVQNPRDLLAFLDDCLEADIDPL